MSGQICGKRGALHNVVPEGVGIECVARYGMKGTLVVLVTEPTMLCPGTQVRVALCGQPTQTQMVVPLSPLMFKVPHKFSGACVVTLSIVEEGETETECMTAEFEITPQWTEWQAAEPLAAPGEEAFFNAVFGTPKKGRF